MVLFEIHHRIKLHVFFNVYFNKKLISYCIIFETRDENLKQQWVIKIKHSNVQSIQLSCRHNMLDCVIFIASAKIPLGKECNFSWP